MAHQKQVVVWPADINGTDVDLFLVSYTAPVSFQSCSWGNFDNAIDFGTLQAAQNFALGINSGTVGSTRP